MFHPFCNQCQGWHKEENHMTSNYTVFDIETRSLPAEQLVAQMPEFTAPANYRDPEKIKANIAEQQQRWLADGALSAITGEVICVGTLRNGEYTLWHDEDESQLLLSFMAFMATEIQSSRFMVGFACRTFDVPFLLRRGYRHSLKPPLALWNGRFLNDYIVDIADLWSCGSRDPRDRISLDALARFLGVGQKTGTGADFAQLWVSDRQKAIAYLENDLRLTALAYERMVRM